MTRLVFASLVWLVLLASATSAEANNVKIKIAQGVELSSYRTHCAGSNFEVDLITPDGSSAAALSVSGKAADRFCKNQGDTFGKPLEWFLGQITLGQKAEVESLRCSVPTKWRVVENGEPDEMILVSFFEGAEDPETLHVAFAGRTPLTNLCGQFRRGSLKLETARAKK